MTDQARQRPVVPVHTCAAEEEAEVVVGLLRANDIESFPNSELPPSVLPVAGPLGQVTIYVDESNRDRAIEIIEAQLDANG
jgi:hypothetical protein